MKLSKNSPRTLVVGALSLVLLGGKTYASEVVLDAVNSGFYNIYGYTSQSSGFHGNILMLGPWNPGGTPLYHNWLGFDMSLVEGTIVNATLQIYSDPRNASGQMILWRDVTTPYSQLGLEGTTPADRALGKQIFDEMGTGAVYGEGLHIAGILNDYILTDAAIDSLNAADSMWAISGENLDTIPSPDNLNTAYGYTWGAFGYSWNPFYKPQIHLKLEIADSSSARIESTDISTDVPEAGSTLAMLGLGLLGSIALRNRVTDKK